MGLGGEGVQEITLLPGPPSAGKELNAHGSLYPVLRNQSENRCLCFCCPENSQIKSLELPTHILTAKISISSGFPFLLTKYFSPTSLTNTCKHNYFLLFLVFWPCENSRLKSLLNHLYFFLWLSGLWNWRVARGPNTGGIYLFREKCGLICALMNTQKISWNVQRDYKGENRTKQCRSNPGHNPILQIHGYGDKCFLFKIGNCVGEGFVCLSASFLL